MKPGWYPDPDDDSARRYWDGEVWSAPLPRDVSASGYTPTPPAESPVQRSTPRRARTFLIASAAIVLLLAAAVTALVLVKQRNDDDDRTAAAAASSSNAALSSSRAAASASQSSAARASRAAVIRQRNNLERARRRLIVLDMQKSITKDARSDVADGLLDGPIKFTDCTPVAGGSTDLLTDTTGQFDCLAVTETHSDGTERGYNFSATVNWTRASYSWHLGN